MVILAHIIIALATLGSATGSLALSSNKLMRATPYLLAGTFVSGSALIVVNPAVSLTHLCLSGLALSAVTVGLHIAARRRIAYAR